ncbi:uncharacterized protein LOC126735171 isoform X2 [Anthonomus grandis grandis]|uniref:uncharacterized protein LOC126735171 isoform X2 n=1 Tax=Anthonomus grandis grandis TaxID=2921223 RepID=UPI0021669FD7|nr:uncharacterized protein LOC126735171 isoform X2 [Anthonomus grandis grandis]
MELVIQSDRVMLALEKTSTVLNVMAKLPYLLENDFEIIRTSFSEEASGLIILTLKKFENSETDRNTKEYLSDSQKTSKLELESHISEYLELDHSLSQLIDMIFTNNHIRQKLEDAKGICLFPYILEFINHFKKLEKIAKFKLYVTGTEEEARDKRLREAFKSNNMLTSTIEDLKTQLETQRNDLGNELQKNIEVLEKYNNKIASIRAEVRTRIEKKIYDSEKAAMDDLERKLCEQEDLFITLMAEKKKEEEKTCQEIAYKILVNRSAKVIQRAWRAYREKKSKRRGKKGKKGKSQGKK